MQSFTVQYHIAQPAAAFHLLRAHPVEQSALSDSSLPLNMMHVFNSAWPSLYGCAQRLLAVITTAARKERPSFAQQ